jgi:ADP-ribose pyrophosphatase YjhB (NUDIX family)
MLKTIRYCPYCGDSLQSGWWEGRNRLHCSGCDSIIYENPLPATCVVVSYPPDRVLLVKRSIEPKLGQWCLPGGFIEIDETPPEGALRELKEETGLTGNDPLLLGVSVTPGTIYKSILMVGYLVTDFQGSPQAGDDASEVGIFDLSELPQVAFSSHAEFIRQFAGDRFDRAAE